MYKCKMIGVDGVQTCSNSADDYFFDDEYYYRVCYGYYYGWSDMTVEYKECKECPRYIRNFKSLDNTEENLKQAQKYCSKKKRKI